MKLRFFMALKPLWRPGLAPWGLALLALMLVGWAISPARAQGSTDANGTWTGTLRFVQPNAKDVSWKLIFALKNYKLRKAFDCFDIWWLPPGRVFSIQGEVADDGELKELKVKWGHVTYAKLKGSLSRAGGKAGGLSIKMAVGNPGDVKVHLALTPLGQQAKTMPEKDPAAKALAAKLAGLDGRYAGHKVCEGPGGYPMQVDIELTLKSGQIQAKYNASQSTGIPYERKFEFQLDENLSARMTPRLAEMTFNFATSPPTVDIRGCTWALKKTAGPDLAALNGRYVGGAHCDTFSYPSQQDIVAVVKAGRVAVTLNFSSIAGIPGEHQTELSLDKNNSIQFDHPASGIYGKVKIDFSTTPAKVYGGGTFGDCTWTLKKTVGTDPVASKKGQTGTAEKAKSLDLSTLDGRYVGGATCDTFSNTSQQNIIAVVKSRRVAVTFSYQWSASALQEYRTELFLNKNNSIQFEHPQSITFGMVRIDFNTTPVKAYGGGTTGDCTWTLKKTAAK